MAPCNGALPRTPAPAFPWPLLQRGLQCAIPAGVSWVSWNTQTCMGVGSDLALDSESIQHQCCLEVGWAWDVLVPFPGLGGQSELPVASSVSSISSQGPFPWSRYDPAHCHATAKPCLSLLQSASTTSPSSLPTLGRDAHLGAEHPPTGCQQVTSPCSKPVDPNRAAGPLHTDGHGYGLDAHSTFPWVHTSVVEQSPVSSVTTLELCSRGVGVCACVCVCV